MLDQIINKDAQQKILLIVKYLLRNIVWLVLAFVVAGLISYFSFRKVSTTYSATITFVLSTDQPQSGVNALAAQLGVDVSSTSSNGIFSGDNMIELFKSRSLVGTALNHVIDTSNNETLLNLIAQRYMGIKNANIGRYPAKYSNKETTLYRRLITQTAASFAVIKKDKKLIFYNITSSGTDPDVTYFTAKCILDEAAKEFIETKTKNSARAVTLLQHQADSMSMVIKNLYGNSASILDATYNLNPSLSAQRTGLQYNQVRAMAYGTAFTEVMRNLETAKINLQKETPLFKIIDEPELPLIGSRPSVAKHVAIKAIMGFIIMLVLLVLDFLYIKK